MVLLNSNANKSESGDNTDNLISLLYVDDEPDLLTLGKIFLERSGGFKVETQNSPEKALNSSLGSLYDAIVSDYQMPGMDGITFLKAVREQYGDIPFILFTGRGREEVVIEAINNGADFYLQKGGEPAPQFAELSHKIKQAVRRKKAEDEQRAQLNELVRTKEALEESEAKFRGIIETSPDAIWEISLDGVFSYVSPRSTDIIGYTPEELIGEQFSRLLPPKSHSFIQSMLENASNRKPGLVTFDVPAIHKNGNIRILNCRSYPLISPNGSVIGFRGITIDDTEKNQYVRALHESETRIRSFIEATSEAVSIIDEEGTIVEWNVSSEKITGIPKGEAFGNKIWDFPFIYGISDCKTASPPSDIKQAIQNSLKTGEPIFKDSDIFEFKRADGTKILTRRTIFPIKTEKGYRFGSLARDITEERRMADALQESENRFRGMAERSSDLIIVLNNELSPIYVSPSSRSITGYDPEELIGKTPDFALSNIFSHSVPDISDSVKKTMNRNVVENVEIQVQKKDGSLIFVNLHAVPVIQNGEMTGVQVSMRDITHIKRAQLDLKESEEKFVTIFQNNPVPLTLLSAATGEFTDVNGAFLQSSGYTRDEVIGKTPGDLGIFANETEFERLTSDIRKNKVVKGMDVHFRRKSGEERDCQTNLSLFYIHNRPQILASIEDVTDQKATESAMKAMVRGIVGSTGKDSLYHITESISSWLSADCVLIGEVTPDKEHIHVLSMILDGERGRSYTHPLKGSPCEYVINNGFTIYHDNLSSHFPECNFIVDHHFQSFIGALIKDSEGKTVGTLGILSRNAMSQNIPIKEIIDIIAVKAGADIERSRIEQTLINNERLLADTMDMANLVSWHFDFSSQVFVFNDRFYALYGTTAEREGGYHMNPERYVREFVHPADIPRILEEVKKTFSTPDPNYVAHHEHRIIRRDGEVRHISVRVRLICDEEGKIIKTLGANQDITDQKNIEDAILKANRQLSLLTSITRHDILNKISSFYGYLRLVEMESTNPEIQNYIQKMIDGIKEIQSQIEFSRVYENLGSQKPQWLLLETILPRTSIPQSVKLQENGLEYSIFVDPMFERVFYNLLENSVRHGEHVYEIRVYTRQDDHGLTVVWEDNGVGIPTEEKEQIFERGYGKNTGHGLFLVREILSLTGIEIQEIGIPGSGARFEIRVPSGSFTKR
ncbi:PAS domain S-box protein [uncultured Methanospirillum sp.]|uniref:hybrid sensor histidine kinase/response regulator n=1 Tax=uncultured Methanospirillum sp. TaxID=262503 RepID=UPI0029C6F127|nr:PAS domain S-box protein [uncultured Methanospirillum sp.]